MRKNKVSRPSVLILVSMALMITIGCLGCATPEKSRKPKTDASTPTARVSAAPKEAPSTLSAVSPQMAPAAPFYPTPTQWIYAGSRFPCIRKTFSNGSTRNSPSLFYNHAQVYLWLKRMERYFPWIEERLRRYGLPDDLKYVVIAESDLVPNVASNKGAAGPWQFMPSTGSSYGLEQRGSFDGRYDFERSTEVPFGSWKTSARGITAGPLPLPPTTAGQAHFLRKPEPRG